MLAKMLFLALQLLFILFNPSLASERTYDVVKMGAKPDGKTNSTQAFINSWSTACSEEGAATIYVPQGQFLLSSIVFVGKHCKSIAIRFHIKGTLVAPLDYNAIGNSGSWIRFDSVFGVSVYGGTLNARGTSLWNCKASGKSCPTGATTLAFYNSNKIVISGLTSVNSQMFHILIHGCQNANLTWVNVSASRNSPNTDGIHLSSSTGVTILNTQIGTGDDCISISPGTSNVWIENISCGPGHGLSIGSLGWNLQEPGVEIVTVKNVTFTNSRNGMRIKTWARDSNGFARHLLYQNVTMVNVENPIIIDQHYCPHLIGCLTQDSGVKISNVTYLDITGTSATKFGVKLDCSKSNPCREITLQDVNLTYGNQIAQVSCANVEGDVCNARKH